MCALKDEVEYVRFAMDRDGMMDRRRVLDTYATIVRGEGPLRACRAGRPNVTKSCGKKWSGGFSECCLLTAGSNLGDDRFSLSSSDISEPEKGSLENPGLVGVAGISSERSETLVAALIGVLAAVMVERTGVMGRGRDERI